MTRYEAKLEFFTLLESGIIDFKEKNIIDKIYDSFENRSCKNCKYSTLDSARYLPVHKCLVSCNGVNYDFYCNKWEPK